MELTLFRYFFPKVQRIGILYHPRFNTARRYLATGVSLLISLGFIAPVLAVVFGVLE